MKCLGGLHKARTGDVTPQAGGVDWNMDSCGWDFASLRGHPPRGGCGLKFGQLRVGLRRLRWSPPTRGVWIEIRYASQKFCFCRSPPTRGVWIEM